MPNLTRPRLSAPKINHIHTATAKGSKALQDTLGHNDPTDVPKALAGSYRSIVGAFCQKRRKAAGLTQAQVADLCGIGATAVSGYETGRGQLPPGRYEKLAELYGLDEKEYGEFLLRYTNPWIYALIYGSDRALSRDLGRAAPGSRYKFVPTEGVHSCVWLDDQDHLTFTSHASAKTASA